MKFIKLHQIAVLAFTLLLGSTTWATVPANSLPATSLYNADPQNLYVQDATAQGIGNVNMILCIMNGMGVGASGMLNNGAYLALVDINKCQSAKGGGGVAVQEGHPAVLVRPRTL